MTVTGLMSGPRIVFGKDVTAVAPISTPDWLYDENVYHIAWTTKSFFYNYMYPNGRLNKPTNNTYSLY
jgi:hypothetical protein